MEINPYALDFRNLIKLDSNISMLKFEEEEDKYILYLKIKDIPVKLVTDFDIYCYLETDNFNPENFDIENLNLEFLNSNKKDPVNIVSTINNILLDKKKYDTEIIEDSFHIYQKISNTSKFPIDYKLLEKESKIFRENKQIVDISKFPKELLFNPNQIYQIIKNEIQKINENNEYKHFIIPSEFNPYNLSLRLKLNNPIMLKINEIFGYDYIELRMILEPKMYPFFPPKLEFIKPSIKFPLVNSLMNLKILKTDNWVPTIQLEFLVVKLAEELEKVIQDYIKLEESKFINLEFLFVKLSSMIKENNNNEEIIKIEIPKINELNTDNKGKYWKSGVGYGNDSVKSWDITAYIKEQEILSTEMSILIENINKELVNDTKDIVFDSILPNFLNSRISGLTLLELEKNNNLYYHICECLNKIMNFDKNEKIQKFINQIGEAFKIISEEIVTLFATNPETQNNILYMQIHCVADFYKSNMKIVNEVKPQIISDNILDKYMEFMKKHQFGTYEIPTYHKYLKEKDANHTAKSTMRIISEVSSFKNGLPLNWESTIWTRISKKSINIFSFFISGPKDTPYENGIFEFHAHFPIDYPNSPPTILIHTTGSGNVRFNPNLYACGKVCLSLLGTWSGQEGEKWNPKNSTFLQVLVSIQSLIFVENPYFNEPGYEKNITTKLGQDNSKSYNQNLYANTIKFAVNDMIKKPPASMEEVIKQHFLLKKDELITTTQKWLDSFEFKNHQKVELENARNEMIKLLDNLK